MKKLFACFLALMMAILPLAATAEGTPTSSFDYTAIKNDAHMSVYTQQGQKLVLDFAFNAGEELVNRLPEKYRNTFNTLLDMLKLEFRLQNYEGYQQYTLILKLENKPVVSVTAAITAEGMFVCTSVTDDTYLVTPEELPEGFHQKMVSMLDDTTISTNKLSALTAMFCRLMWTLPFVPDLLSMITTKTGLPLSEEYLVNLVDSYLFSSLLYVNESHTVNPDGTFVMGLDGRLVLQSAESENTTPVLLRVAFESRDKGDHAEGTADLEIDLEGKGRLISARIDIRTDLADAWIHTAGNVIRPSQMTPAEQEALVRETKENALFTLGLTLLRMPSSVGSLLSSFFFK